MVRSLGYLGSLPDNTIVYNGHEYTAGNVAFAKSIDPDNSAIQRLDELAKTNKITTGLTTIADEKEWNVFIRFRSEAVRLVSLHIRISIHLLSGCPQKCYICYCANLRWCHHGFLEKTEG